MPELICPTCGKLFHRSPSQLKEGRISYCSQDCLKTPCPYSASDLYQMYWVDDITFIEIAQMQSPHVAENVVKRWYREAGIRRRTLKEHNQKLADAGHSSNNAIKARKNLAKHRKNGLVTSDGSHLHTPENKAKQRLAVFKQRIRETRNCARVGCPNTVTRKPSEFGRYENSFCSKSCAQSVKNYLRYAKSRPYFTTCQVKWMRDAKVLADIRAGDSVELIANRFGLSKAQIYLILKKITGQSIIDFRNTETQYLFKHREDKRIIPLRKRSLPTISGLYRSARNESIIKKLQEGYTPKDISRLLKVNPAIIRTLQTKHVLSDRQVITQLETRVGTEVEAEIDLDKLKQSSPELFDHLVKIGKLKVD